MFRCGPDGPRYLLILDAYDNWGFPKGHVDDGEAPAEAARREVAEETGLGGLVLHRPLGMIDWYFRLHGRLIHKHCYFFLFESPAGEPTPQQDEGITACRWCTLDDALGAVPYANARGVLREAADAVHRLCSGSDGTGRG